MNVIGVSCPEFSKTPFDEMCQHISGHFRHWEIFSELNHFGPLVAEKYANLIESSDMTFSLHTGIADINIASTNESIRRASVGNVLSEMESAHTLGIDTVTIHPGIINLAVHDTRGISLEAARRSMKEFDRAASEYGLHACIENMPSFPVMLGVQADELTSIVDGTDLDICFDIGHANTSGQIDAMIDTFGDRIRNIHIHDNLGDRDAHLTIGDGNIDFVYVLKRLSGYSHRFIIECKSLESGIESQSRLRKMLGQ